MKGAKVDTAGMASVDRAGRTSRYNAVLAYLASGLVGGIAGGVFAALTLQWRSDAETVTNPFLSSAPLFSLAAAVAGGILAGWFVAALIVSRAPGQRRWPRCGTANDPRTRLCRACSLSFA
jgi:hypothetical protein